MKCFAYSLIDCHADRCHLHFILLLFLESCTQNPVLLLWLPQIPFCVVIGWIMGRPMDLNFQLFETATLFITVIVVAFFLQVCTFITCMVSVLLHRVPWFSSWLLLLLCLQEGTSNYFKGLMLILCYLIVAASFFVHEDPTSGGNFLIKTCIHIFAISSCALSFFERSDIMLWKVAITWRNYDLADDNQVKT